MPGAKTFSAAALAALLFPGVLHGASRPAPRVGLVLPARAQVRDTPAPTGKVEAVLVQQTQVEVLKTKAGWDQVRYWGSVKGWIPKRQIGFMKPYPTVSTYHAPTLSHPIHAAGPYAIQVAAKVTAPTHVYVKPGGTGTGSLTTGATVTVTSWQQDAKGFVWYRVRHGWVRGDSVAFDGSRSTGNGPAVWAVTAGKGMWLTLGTVADSDPAAIVKAAQRNGITHLYLESAISPLGFHGEHVVGPLVDAAHRAHLAVIAWVYPYLYDVAADLALTRRVAAYRTSAGYGFDGIAADLEDNIHLWNIRAYSQLLRAYLGPRYLLIGVTYPPQSMPDYPFAEVGRIYNLIVPMDYWHQTKTTHGLNYNGMQYGYEYAYRYATDSIVAIRHATGNVPIAPIGQAFDDFGRLEMGPYAPSQSEVLGFMAGCKASGAVGVSFFQWMTVTDGEWRAIRAFRY